MANFFKKEPIKKEVQKPIFQPKGIFAEKSSISRTEFKKTALKGKYIIPGGGGKVLDKPQIKEMIEKDFPKERFGGQISKKEFQQRLKELQFEKYKAKTAQEKFEIEKKIKFYRKRFLR